MSDTAASSEVHFGERLRLRTDGASRGNPGPAAAGVVIESGAGDTLYSVGVYLGEMPNNQAEYRALIIGLRAVAEFQPAALDVFMDSELVVRQMTGAYRVRDAILQRLHREATTLVQALPRVGFTHVRRAQNALADQLANEALDRHKRATSPSGHSEVAE